MPHWFARVAPLLLLLSATPIFSQTLTPQAQTPPQTATTPDTAAPPTAAQQTPLLPAPAATPDAASSAQPAASPAASPTVAQADDRLTFMEDAGSESPAAAPSTFGLLARTVGALLLILGLIAAAGYALKRFGGTKLVQAQADAPELKVLASLSLGERRTLSVVRFGERTLLVGATAQSVTLLCEKEDIDPLANLVITPPQPRRSVGEMLQTEAGRRTSFDAELFRADTQLANSASASSMSSWANEEI
ncbi:MAG: flagellar biosynthetic protein FliO [Pyrinomonadaceae bacterium]